MLKGLIGASVLGMAQSVFVIDLGGADEFLRQNAARPVDKKFKMPGVPSRKPNSARSRRRGTGYPFRPRYVIKGARP
jgi:hypothetical protein